MSVYYSIGSILLGLAAWWIPYAAIPGSAPSPKKPRPATDIIEFPIVNVAWTIIGPIQFGRTCLSIIITSLCPTAFSASKYSFSFILKTEPLTNLANLGIVAKPTPMTAGIVPIPRIVMKNKESSIVGNAIKTSIIFITIPSIIPPKYPQINPMRIPAPHPINTTATPIIKEVLAPTITLLKISLPISSVPQIWSSLGAAPILYKSISIGSWLAIIGPNKPKKTIMDTINNPIIAILLFSIFFAVFISRPALSDFW